MRFFALLISVAQIAAISQLTRPAAAAPVDLVAGDFEYFAASGGLALEKGSVSFSTAEDCDGLPTCYGNNPSSPYGIPKFRYSGNIYSPEASGYWQLREDQAVVLIVETPPESAYFGFTHYVHDRYYADRGKRLTPYASLGDTINPLTIRHTYPNQDPFEKLTAIVLTASLETYIRIAAALKYSGLAPERINPQIIPYDQVIMGDSAFSDTFQILARLAKTTDPVAYEAYIQNPPMAAYKISAVNASFTPLPAPAIRTKGTGTAEESYRSVLASLEQAIRDRYAGYDALKLTVKAGSAAPEGCLQQGTSCNGDNRDALYETAIVGQMPPSSDDFVIVYGVNHAATGKAVYTNFTNYDLSRLAGVSSVIDDEYSESGKHYLGAGFPDADKVFAYKIARNCHSEPFCIQIPWEGELSIPADKPVMIGFRTYLEEETRTGPLASELLRAGAIRFRR